MPLKIPGGAPLLIIRDTLGREHSAEIEQIASDGSWSRNGRYELHIVGYRSQNIGVPYSTMSIIRAWTVPTLYGERLSLGAYFVAANRRDTIVAVHPFAADRERFYKFSGGDTVTVLRVGTRRVPIARVRVTPSFRGESRWGVFDGEIDLDADRHQIVRMRGRFHAAGGESRRSDRLARWTGIAGAAYVEFVNAEVEGKYWLPAFQRTEFQVSFPFLGQARPVFRIVSTIRDIVVGDSASVTTDANEGRRVIVSWAQGDSTSRFAEWDRELGVQSGSVHADDFADMRAEIDRLQQELIDPRGLERLVQQFITDYFLKNETNSDQATFLARAQLYHGDYRAAARFVESLREVKPEDVRRVAREYMHDFRFVYLGNPGRLSRALIDRF